MRKNIFLALDFNSLDKALEVTNQTKEYLGGIKIGLELYSTIGLEGIKHFEKFNLPIFLDTKIFDMTLIVFATWLGMSKILVSKKIGRLNFSKFLMPSSPIAL